MQPMQLHWAPRQDVWESCSFFSVIEQNDVITQLFRGAPFLASCFSLSQAEAKLIQIKKIHT